MGEDGSLTAIDGEGILLTDKAEIEYVMFLKNDTPGSSPSPKVDEREIYKDGYGKRDED